MAQISEIDSALRKYKEFLQFVFDDLRSEIQELEAKGELIETCPSCGFKSQKHENVFNHIYGATCLVCNLSERSLRMECNKCSEAIIFRNEGFGQCESCHISLEPGAVAEALLDAGSAHVAAMEGDNSWGVGNCSDCDGHETVVFTSNEEWICASCFGTFKHLSLCEWCNEKNTGDMEHSYFSGCNHCDGFSDWHKDD